MHAAGSNNNLLIYYSFRFIYLFLPSPPSPLAPLPPLSLLPPSLFFRLLFSFSALFSTWHARMIFRALTLRLTRHSRARRASDAHSIHRSDQARPFEPNAAPFRFIVHRARAKAPVTHADHAYATCQPHSDGGQHRSAHVSFQLLRTRLAASMQCAPFDHEAELRAARERQERRARWKVRGQEIMSRILICGRLRNRARAALCHA